MYWISPDGGLTWSSVSTMGEVATGLCVGVGGPLTVSDLRRGSVHPIWFWRWDLMVHKWVGYRQAVAFAYLPPIPRAGDCLWIPFRDENASWGGGTYCASWGTHDGLPPEHPVEHFLVQKGLRSRQSIG